jgi:two-component system cell cycle sensor histidine kinase/response regulator CckA
MTTPARKALQFVGAYLVLATIWVAISDPALRALWGDADRYPFGPTLEGFFLVITTGLFLALWIHRCLANQCRCERELLEYQDISTTVLDHAPVLIAVIDRNRRVQYVNPALTRALGWSLADYKRSEPGPANGTSAPPNPLEFIGEPNHPPSLHEVRARDGAVLWIEGCSVRTDQGSIVGIGHDVTELRRAERLRDKLFINSPDLIMVADFDGCPRMANPAWSKLLGWTDEELMAGSWQRFVHPEDAAATAAQLRQMVVEDKPGVLLNRCRCKDHSWKTLSWHGFPLPEEGLVFVIGRDMTERTQLEAQFHGAQRMEGLARLAAGVAHDLRNLLTVIMGRSQLAQLNASGEVSLDETLQEIDRAAQRAAELSDRLLGFGRRQQKSAPSIADLNTVIREARSLIEPVLREDIHLECDLAEARLALRIDASQLEQVLLNLCINARDAMPTGGRLTLRTGTVCLSEQSPHPADLPPGAYVWLDVEDTGVGMAPDIVERIFEPFFTTKGPGRGTGLGLAAVKGIVRGAGGAITVESRLGPGTRFRILLPQSQGTSEAILNPPRPCELPRGRETLLIVDDDRGILEAADRILAGLGYRTLTANDPLKAEEVAAREEGPIDLLLTDAIMPGLSGWDLAGRLQSLRPQLQVVFMSGYREELKELKLPLLENFLAKPFSVELLAHTIRHVLDRAPLDPTRGPIPQERPKAQQPYER